MFNEVLRFFSKNKLRVISTILSSILVFMSLTLSVVLYNYTDSVKKNIEDKVKVAVFIKKEVSKEDASLKESKKKLILNSINKVGNITSVKYSDANDELESIINSVGGEGATTFDDVKEDNPLQDVVYVQVKDSDKIKETVSELEKVKEVDKVEYNKKTTEMYLKLVKILNILGVSSVVGLIFITFPLLVSLITTSISQRKTELKIKSLIGASMWSILGSFVIELLTILGIAYNLNLFLSNYIISLIVGFVSNLGVSVLELNNSNSYNIFVSSSILVAIIGFVLGLVSLAYAFYISDRD